MLQVLAWIGTACFIACVVPQTWTVIRTRSAGTLTWGFLLLWFAGCVCLATFVAITHVWPLLANYTFSLINLSIILWFKVRESRR